MFILITFSFVFKRNVVDKKYVFFFKYNNKKNENSFDKIYFFFQISNFYLFLQISISIIIT